MIKDSDLGKFKLDQLSDTSNQSNKKSQPPSESKYSKLSSNLKKLDEA